MFKKGSLWRKWDLHIHTPASFHWKGGKKFSECTPEEEDEELKKMYDAIEASEIAVFAIMDYWTFDGYIKFKEYVTSKGLKLNKTVLPGMELRVEAPVDYRLNLHIIASDKLSFQDLNNFKSKLSVKFSSTNSQPVCDQTLINFARTLDDSKMRHHGFDPSKKDDKTMLKLGSATVEITQESLNEAIKVLPKDTIYIIMPYDTSDGLKDLNWKNHPHADNYFMQSSHIFESRDNKSIKLFLGIMDDNNKEFIANFLTTLNNKIKPVICGSDAHKFVDYGKYPSNKQTWIKADPTFEGFKQILFEPKDRVFVGQNQPEQKKPYYVIDKVRFIDNTGEFNFSNEEIEINSNLTSIIGGKSTGKSLLLHYIAKTIDISEVEKRYKNISIQKYDLDLEDNFNFEVIWADGTKNILKQPENFSSEEPINNDRKILYIPQTYLNNLSERNIDTKKTLNSFVLNVLLQNSQLNKIHEETLQSIKNLTKKLPASITELFIIKDEILSIEEKLKEIGEEAGILSYIKSLEQEIEIIKKESDLTEEEIKQYEILYGEEKRLLNLIAGLNADNETIKQFHNDLLVKFENVLELRSEYTLYLNDPSIKAIFNTEFNKITEFKTTISTFGSVALKKSKELIQQYQGELSTIKQKLLPLINKVKLEKDLKSRLKMLKEEQVKLDDIEYLKKSLKAKNENLANKNLEVLDQYKSIFNKFETLKNEFSKYENNLPNILLKVNVNFYEDEFNYEVVDQFLNKHDLKALQQIFSKDEYHYKYSAQQHLESIKNIYLGLVNKRINTVKNRTIKDAILKLLENKFYIDFNISYKGDPLDKMSPGKKGLVLLRLLIDLSDKKWPILLDQPEDDLDNRSIYEDLVGFMKEKKKERQILIVTHNPNLVVGADAEEVIVANQAGQETGRDKRDYKFEYVTGSLENAFDDASQKGILYQKGIREHVCEILEGGKEAFLKREQKYSF